MINKYFWLFLSSILILDLPSSASPDEITDLTQQLYAELKVEVPEKISAEMKPGYLYRVSEEDPKSVVGVYAKKIKYYEESLLPDKITDPIKNYVLSQSGGKGNWLGVVFWGVWSYGEDNDNLITVRVPVRSLKTTTNSCMNYTRNGGHYVTPRCIWTAGIDKKANLTDEKGNKFCFITSAHHDNGHTEPKFISYINQENTQKALWNYFIWNSRDILKKKNCQLDCIGFNIYSTNDSCDSCFKKLIALKNKRLAHLPPALSDVSLLSNPLPFLITFESKQHYNPHLENNFNMHNSVYSASLFFQPKPPLQRLFKKKKNKNEYTGKVVKEITDQIIAHQAEIYIEEKQELEYIILKVNQGDDVKLN